MFWAQRGRALTVELVGGNQERLGPKECARIASRAIGLLPAGHDAVTMRVDSAYYAIELLDRLRKEQTRFTVSVPRSQAMWKALSQIPDSDWVDVLIRQTAARRTRITPAASDYGRECRPPPWLDKQARGVLAG